MAFSDTVHMLRLSVLRARQYNAVILKLKDSLLNSEHRKTDYYKWCKRKASNK